jgi:hypothetical protein
MNNKMDKLIHEISQYEVTEEQFRRECCTAYDLCDHQVMMKIPQDLWFALKELLSKIENKK